VRKSCGTETSYKNRAESSDLGAELKGQDERPRTAEGLLGAFVAISGCL
jgi:hypothetical protein